MYSILNIIPFFVEIKKLRFKKNNEDNLIKRIIIINKYLKYNLKLRKFLSWLLNINLYYIKINLYYLVYILTTPPIYGYK